MRLWTLHPAYLDSAGLVALWREALLAQSVLNGCTRGYKHHPQLQRFQEQPNPVAAIASYLDVIHIEASRRGYRFDVMRIGPHRSTDLLDATEGQLAYEWMHLKAKLQRRRPEQLSALAHIQSPEPHPLFRIIPGGISSWEKRQA